MFTAVYVRQKQMFWQYLFYGILNFFDYYKNKR